jgi:hypothetical protein
VSQIELHTKLENAVDRCTVGCERSYSSPWLAALVIFPTSADLSKEREKRKNVLKSKTIPRTPKEKKT